MSSEQTKSVWTVHVDSYKPFTMGGVPMTHAQALETARSIWSKSKKVSVR